MDTITLQALGFLPFVIPICLYVAYSDMKGMIIPNKAVYALFAVFIIVGFFLFPSTDAYLWRFSHFAVISVLGIVLNAIGFLGAGDAKFMAAAAPMVAISDIGFLSIVFGACLLSGYALHRLAKNSPLRKMVPDWESWDSGRRFPMGFPLAMTLVAYLVLTMPMAGDAA